MTLHTDSNGHQYACFAEEALPLRPPPDPDGELDFAEAGATLHRLAEDLSWELRIDYDEAFEHIFRTRPDLANAYAGCGAEVLNFSEHEEVGREVDSAIQDYMATKNLDDYGLAMNHVFAEDPALKIRYFKS